MSKAADTELKNYEVQMTAYMTVVVMAASGKEEAYELAEEYNHGGYWQFDSATCRVISGSELDSCRSHADAIVEPDGVFMK